MWQTADTAETVLYCGFPILVAQPTFGIGWHWGFQHGIKWENGPAATKELALGYAREAVDDVLAADALRPYWTVAYAAM